MDGWIDGWMNGWMDGLMDWSSAAAAAEKEEEEEAVVAYSSCNAKTFCISRSVRGEFSLRAFFSATRILAIL